MKQINFIKTLSPAHQHTLAVWYHLSVILSFVVCITIMVCQTVQLFTYVQLKRENAYWAQKQVSLNHSVAKKNELIQKRAALEKKLHTLQSASDSLLTKAFQTCINALPKTASLQTLSLSRRQITATITCAKPVQAITYANALADSGLFASVKLIQLKTYTDKETQTLQATINAVLHSADVMQNQRK